MLSTCLVPLNCREISAAKQANISLVPLFHLQAGTSCRLTPNCLRLVIGLVWSRTARETSRPGCYNPDKAKSTKLRLGSESKIVFANYVFCYMFLSDKRTPFGKSHITTLCMLTYHPGLLSKPGQPHKMICTSKSTKNMPNPQLAVLLGTVFPKE